MSEPGLEGSDYGKAIDFPQTYELFLTPAGMGTFGSPAVRGVARAFAWNMLRVRSLLIFPALVLNESRYDAGQGAAGQFEADLASVERFIAERDAGIREGAVAVLSGAILAAWTAFETMAGDLWEVAVNADPDGLGALTGKVRVRGEVQEGEPQQKGGPGKSIPLEVVRSFGYDLRGRMGAVWRSTRGISFQRLSSIRENYQKAFWRHDQAIDEALFRVGLRAASAVRNLLVHKAGVIDQKFIEDAKGVPRFEDAEVGETLPVDGALVAYLLGGVVSSSLDLLHGVDGWLAAHAGKKGG